MSWSDGVYHKFADCLEIFLQRYVNLFQNSNKRRTRLVNDSNDRHLAVTTRVAGMVANVQYDKSAVGGAC